MSYRINGNLALCKSKLTGVWSWEDITGATLRDLCLLYRAIEVPIKNAFDDPLTLDLCNYAPSVSDSSLTIEDWLVSMATHTLTTAPGYPILNEATARYFPATTVCDSIQLCTPYGHPSNAAPESDKTDIIVNHAQVDNAVVHATVLWSVNGYFVSSVWTGYGIRLLGGGTIVLRDRTAVVGGLNFGELGSVQQVPITPEMIYKLDPTKSLFDALLITSPVPLLNKAVGVVIGGHLHLMDGLVKVLSDNTLTISMRNFKLVERLLQSSKSLELDYTDLWDADGGFNPSAVLDEAKLLTYLTAIYSFLVIIDNADISKHSVRLSNTAIIGNYIGGSDFVPGLLVNELGKHMEYVDRDEDGNHTLITNESHLPNYLLRDTEWVQVDTLNSGATGGAPVQRIMPNLIHFKGRV